MLFSCKTALFYAKNIINNTNESCEGEEYIKKNHIVDRYELNKKTL